MTTEEKLKNAMEALSQLAELNPLKNDFDDYLLHLAHWGMGEQFDEDTGEWVFSESVAKPNPEDFGLKFETKTWFTE